MVAADKDWIELAELDEAQREAQMRARYSEMTALAEEDRQARLRAMVEAEYTLPDETLRPFTKSRLRTWLDMEPEAAQTIARSYDAVMERMPGSVAMRRVAAVQMMARQLSLGEQERLAAMLPHVLPEREGETGPYVSQSAPSAVKAEKEGEDRPLPEPPTMATPMPGRVSPVPDQVSIPPQATPKRLWWRFWKKAA